MENKADLTITFRCCWTCKHCELDILRGYECVANPNLFPIHLADRGETSSLHTDRSNCKAYVRG
jgi:hypothetical protein